jgi:hypothetical protein
MFASSQAARDSNSKMRPCSSWTRPSEVRFGLAGKTRPISGTAVLDRLLRAGSLLVGESTGMTARVLLVPSSNFSVAYRTFATG